MSHSKLQYRFFLFLLVVVSVLFGWLLWPFYGAVFWGTILAILFAPVHRRLVPLLGDRRNLAALTTVLGCLLIVILPTVMITVSLVGEGAAMYARVKSGELDFGAYFQQVFNAMPPFAHELLARLGVTDVSSLRERLTSGLMEGGQFIAGQALNIGQNTAQFVISLGIMLYLLFFLLRDGAGLSRRIKQAIPLSDEHKRTLFVKFTAVVRATVKGNIVVAAVQGALGGLMFWVLGIQGALLWAVVMGILSLLPAVGAGLIWGPVAIYYLVAGQWLHGLGVIAFGVVVIGLVDNILRPVLVGKDTQMPDYVVLIATLGGMALFGLNGFVIGPLIAALFISAWDLFSSVGEAQEGQALPGPAQDGPR